MLIDASTGQETDLGEAVGEVASLNWSPDAAEVTYNSSPSGSIYSVRIEDGTRSLLVEDLGFVHGDIGDGTPWSPDGTRIAIELSDDPIDLYVMNADGSDVRLIERHVDGGSWSTDGRRLAFATFTGPRGERTARIWTISVDDETPLLVLKSDSPRAWEGIAWSPDGTRIAFDIDGGDGVGSQVTNADGSGDPHRIDDLVRESWQGGGYSCGCYG